MTACFCLKLLHLHYTYLAGDMAGSRAAALCWAPAITCAKKCSWLQQNYVLLERIRQRDPLPWQAPQIHGTRPPAQGYAFPSAAVGITNWYLDSSRLCANYADTETRPVKQGGAVSGQGPQIVMPDKT